MRLADRFAVAAALLAPFLCLGVGSAFGAEPTSAPAGPQPQTAQIQLLSNPNAGYGALQTLYLVKNMQCGSLFWSKVLGSFGMRWLDKKGPVAIPAGKVAYLWMVEDAPSREFRRRLRCDNAGQLIPEAGHSYDVQQTSNSWSCRLTVIDRATNLPPLTYRPFSPDIFCHSKK